MKKVPFAIRLIRLYINTLGRLNKKKTATYLINLFSTPRNRVIREKEVEALKQAKSSTIEFKGQQVRLYEWGTGEDYVLLCHGWESNAGSLGSFVNPLIERGYRVISYDGPAHGASEGKQANLILFTQLAKTIIKKYGTPKIAIGHSLGANVILFLAYQTQLEIEKSVLISPVNRVSEVFDGFQQLFKVPDFIYREMLEQIENRFDYKVEALDSSKIGPQTKLKKVLLMHDVDDKITSVKHSEEIAEAWKKVNYQPIDGSGHYKILWHKSTLEKTFEFLDA